MNKYSFTIAAVFGAALASAQTCQQPLTTPPAQDFEDKRLQEVANFLYMDQCAVDEVVSWFEYEQFVSNILDQGVDRDADVRNFQKIDLNNDNQHSLEERLRYKQVENASRPVDLPPFIAIAEEIFSALDCRPQEQFAVQNCDGYYTREDLKAALPILIDIEDIYADHVKYEAYISHEMSLRDYDNDGQVSREEQGSHDGHYKYMRNFWNYAKGQGWGIMEALPGDDDLLTHEQWMQQDNPWVRRDYPALPFEIPSAALEERFQYFDKNGDLKLNWWEVWSTIQEDDMQFREFRPYFYSFKASPDDSEADEYILLSQVVSKFTEQNPSMTPEEIQTMADEFFARYNRNTGDTVEGVQVIRKWGMWPIWHWGRHLEEQELRRIEHQRLDFEQNFWYQYNLNRDPLMTLTELAAGDATMDAALEVFDILQVDLADSLEFEATKDGLLQYEETQRIVLDQVWIQMRIDDQPITLITIPISDPMVKEILGVATDEELIVLDKNSDGVIDYEEACRHYIVDFDYFCRSEPLSQHFTVTNNLFERFWNSMDQIIAHDDVIEQSVWASAVTDVDIFANMTEEQIMTQFDLHDMNDDMIVTADEARHVFYHAENAQQVVESVEEIWSEVDGDSDGNLTDIEFLNTYNLLYASDLIPQTDTAVVMAFYERELELYNETAAEPAVTLPMDTFLNLVREATLAAWVDLTSGTE